MMDEKPKIRARQKVRNIKSINKASVFSRRLKSSFIRARSNAENVGETKQLTPSDYAEDKLKNSAETTALTAQKTAAKGRQIAKNRNGLKKASKPAKAAEKKANQTAARAAKAAVAKARGLISALAAGGSAMGMIIVVICLIGLLAGSCFGIFFSGEDTGNGMSMQTAIKEINDDYNAKLEELESAETYDRLEISNAHPNWPEVLAVYAVKTSANTDVVTVTDEKVEILKAVFWDMNEISSGTETRSTTVVTETADENGNIVVEESTQSLKFLYISVSHKTAEEMSEEYGFTDEQKKRLGELLSEENSGLWSSVLYGIGKSDDEIVKIAMTQLGNAGGQPYWSWYGFGSRVEWCACFVSWCANEGGYIDSGVIPKFASCTWGVQWFKDHNQWQPSSYTPKAGDIIFFDWEQDGSPDHVGIVESVSDGYVNTVEGNSKDSCRQRQYSLSSSVIYGYGIPAY